MTWNDQTDVAVESTL